MIRLMTVIAVAGSAFLASPAIAQDTRPFQPDGTAMSIGDTATTPAVGSQVQLEGVVDSVDAWDGVFVLDAGARQIQVEVAGMDDYPLDADGTPQITAGDRVRITARVGEEYFGPTTEVMATSVAVLSD